ncbi:MAG: hypothetical protein HC920_10200 [Oscillatoriales cyanobacterium SM2_3_0]|nr:hypothetical protein [Oscillatoriales cyanobacterium SM2_3_0]
MVQVGLGQNWDYPPRSFLWGDRPAFERWVFERWVKDLIGGTLIKNV